MEAMRNEFIYLSGYAFDRLAKRVADLTDEEYFWEPVADCWAVRRQADGTFQGDWGVLFDEPAPFTTIAWRIGHIIDCLTGERCGRILGQEPVASPIANGLPGTADDARGSLAQANEIWQTYVAHTDDEFLIGASGPSAGMWSEYSRASFVLHIIDELIHHAAEVGVVRDLYRSQHMRDEPADPILHAAELGRWHQLPSLLESDLSIAGRNGRTPLHHAAAAGRIDIMRALIDRGAEVDVKDPVYDSTPLGWAEYFHQTDAADFLKGNVAKG